MKDFEFFAKEIPNYFVQCDNGTSSNGLHYERWRCRSNTGMSDSGTEEQWNFFVKAVKERWPGRFIEIDHTVNANHTDFDIYLKA
jgi:hypothetical protein